MGESECATKPQRVCVRANPKSIVTVGSESVLQNPCRFDTGALPYATIPEIRFTVTVLSKLLPQSFHPRIEFSGHAIRIELWVGK